MGTVPEKDEIKANNEDRVFVVKIMRISGDPLVFTRLKNGFLLTYCSSIIKGLPSWARQLEDDEEAKKNKTSKDEEKEKENAELVDDYSKELEKHFQANGSYGMPKEIAVKN